MKINNSILTKHNDIKLQYIELSERVNCLIKRKIKKSCWHYLSRIKCVESYALKIETGRADPNNFEDFFACTIVVENSTQISEAENKINKYFNVIYQKPFCGQKNYEPSSFKYNNLRLYVKLRKNESLPPNHSSNVLTELLFEIQIKTFLQHAWDVATHDIIYKNNEFMWSKERIGFQIKAMLEHAEISLHEINTIKKSDILNKSSKYINRLIKIKKVLNNIWDLDSLPNDQSRLIKNVENLLQIIDLDINDLEKYLKTESSERRGNNIKNLSPFSIIIQTIINQNPKKLTDFFSKPLIPNIKNKKIFISKEINIKDIVINESKVFQL